MRVLVVEDSESLRRSLKTALRNSGYAVDTADNGQEGLWLAKSNGYDAIVLDVMLPRLDGLELLKQLRAAGNSGHVLLLTARDTVDDRVAGLRAGADDYLIKPFALEELLARVDALCRRRYGQKSPKLQIADMTIDLAARVASIAGSALDLTPREFRLLEFLALRSGEVVSRTEIEEHLYDTEVDPLSNVVDSAVCSLRKKISAGNSSSPVIHTRRGEGYVLEARS